MSDRPRREKPIVALVGRPNVGKSRLFNRMLRRARSIVDDMPGVTRDRIYADAVIEGDYAEAMVVLVDTGGFDPGSVDPIARRVLEQTQLAIDEADVVVFLTDGRAGLVPEDEEIGRLLRKGNKSVIVAVNKVDGPAQQDLLHEFHRLGFPSVIAVSAAHGRHVGELQELVLRSLPHAACSSPPSARGGTKGTTDTTGTTGTSGEAEQDDESELAQASNDQQLDPPIRVAVIGRPNSGKSSLVNRLVGEDRHLVSEVAGTTVDAVDSLIEHRGQRYLLIDTAGIRRKRSIAMRLERFSVIAALKGLERSDVALLLLDSTQPISAQDAKVAAFAYEKGKAVILVVSKWDLGKRAGSERAFADSLRHELKHLSYAPVVFTSAHTGLGADQLLPAIRRVHSEYGHRETTGRLNRLVEGLMVDNPPPSKKGRRGRIYYITQIDVRPPRFLVSVNDPELFHFSYRRFLVNELRRAYGFSGSPVLVGYRSHKKTRSEERDAPARRPKEKGIEARERSAVKRATHARRARKKDEGSGARPKRGK